MNNLKIFVTKLCLSQTEKINLQELHCVLYQYSTYWQPAFHHLSVTVSITFLKLKKGTKNEVLYHNNNEFQLYAIVAP